ncbi:hypothetical protein BH09PSE5_BH09PSE5_44860 [soil metagenome]
MSVILRGSRWPGSRVPYVINDGSLMHDRWFEEVNAAMGYRFLLRARSGDASRLVLTVGAMSRSEVIGWSGRASQAIGGTDKQSVVHELLHALGFKHEQLHRHFPWDDEDPVVQKPDRMFRFYGHINTERNKLLHSRICGKLGTFYGDNNLISRVIEVRDIGNEHRGPCDLDSVMMYSSFRDAVISAGCNNLPDVTSSGMSPHCDVLSNDDVDTLRYMYPPP